MSSEACRGLEAPCLKPGSVAPLFVWFDLNWDMGPKAASCLSGLTRERAYFQSCGCRLTKRTRKTAARSTLRWVLYCNGPKNGSLSQP